MSKKAIQIILVAFAIYLITVPLAIFRRTIRGLAHRQSLFDGFT